MEVAIEQHAARLVEAHAPPLALVCLLALSACAGAPEVVRSAAATPRGSIEARVATHSKQLLPPPWSSNMSVQPQPSGAARRVLETAEQMVEDGRVVRGSCYRYIDTVFDTAGYTGWRQRSTVFRGSTSGPYADLDLIQPGDWLWIVNHPELDPVGTHSVLFVEWEDRAAGYARVVSYVGGSADRPADYVTYEVSRTYGIQRPVDAQPRPARRRGRRGS